MLGIIAGFEQNYPFFAHLEGIPIVPDSTFVCWNGPIWTSTRAEQLLTGLCWKSRLASKRNHNFPSWSWTGWYGGIRARKFNEGFVHNVYEVTFPIEFPSGDKIDLDSFGGSFYAGYEGSYTSQRTILIILAPLISVQLWLSEKRHKRRLTGDLERTRWNAFIEVGDVTIPCKAFYPTLDIAEIAGDCTRDNTLALQGLVMGVRRGTYTAGYGTETRRTLSGEQDNHLVLMVVRQLGNGARERVGLLEMPWSQENTKRANYGQRLLTHLETIRQRIRLV
jgi:hypothetical protein